MFKYKPSRHVEDKITISISYKITWWKQGEKDNTPTFIMLLLKHIAIGKILCLARVGILILVKTCLQKKSALSNSCQNSLFFSLLLEV